MSLTAPAPPPVTPAPARPPALGAVRGWSLALTDDPDALVRVLTLLRRRRCRVLSVGYEVGDLHRPGTRLRVLVRPDGGRPDALDAWLAGLPDVLDVTRAT